MRENLFFSLRFRLVGLVLLAVLPALMLLVFFSWEHRRHTLEEARQKARTLALVTSEQFNHAINDQEQILYTLSLLPQAKGRDLAALNLTFAELLKKPAGVLGFRLTDAQGRVLGGVPPPAMPASYADRDWFRRLQETRRFQVSDFVIGKTIPQPIMPMAYPVLNSRGEIDGILVASFSVGWLDDFLKKCQLPPGTHALLVDRQGAILANYPHTGEKVGESLPQAPLIRAMLDRREGFVEAACPGEDIPVLFAFTAVGEGEAPLKLAVGLEQALVLHHVGRGFLFHLSLLGLAAGLALAGSLAFGHLLVRRPVLRILEATRRVAAGDLEARTGLPAGKGELNRLGQGFDEMAAALQQRQAERRQAEESFHRSEQKYRLLVRQIPAMVFQGYGDWSIDPVDEKVEALTGYSKEDFESRRVKWCDLIPAEDLDYAAKVFIEALKTDKSYLREHRLRKKDGEIIWVQCRGQIFLNDQGKVDHISGVSFDVTERRQAEEALKESERFLADIFASIQDGINILDLDYNILRVNPTFERWYAHALPLVGKKCYAALLGRREPCEICPYRQTLETGKAAHKVSQRMGKDAVEAGWIEIFTFPITEKATGKAKGVIEYVRDITEQKQAEEALHRSEAQLRQAVKMEAVGQLAGGVAHDFNNILTAITGYAELLLMNPDIQDPVSLDVKDILKAAERAASLTRQLLAFSRKQVLQPQRLDLNQVVANLDKMLRRIIGEDIDLEMVLGHELGAVQADPGQIEQVIMNLAANARDAMPQGGKLTIETADADLDAAYAQEHLEVQSGPYVMLAVSDTGVGLDQEAQARIFEPFFTTKEIGKGTGLGLSMVYGIVRQSGGFIYVYSDPGDGTTFKIYLPRLEAAGDLAAGLGQVPDRCEWGSETILLVEDEDMVRQVASRILTRHGYTVLEAASGRDALVVSREHGGPIHLMLTDVVMSGMSGWETAENLKPQRPKMKVLFMSGHTENTIVHHGVLDPGVAFIQKPFKYNILAQKIREMLDASQDQ